VQLAIHTVVVGLGATAFMDLWALLLWRTFGVPLANYCLVGRWFCHMPKGAFVHTSIANASPKRLECAVGWIAHYVIGAAYAIAFVALVADAWLLRPALLPALAFGIATVLVPFLVMQPAFGLGIAASKTPNPMHARLRSIMAHTAFAVGLYVSALALNHGFIELIVTS
jgi:hypothetical protein